jgi:hypothetical protein
MEIEPAEEDLEPFMRPLSKVAESVPVPQAAPVTEAAPVAEAAPASSAAEAALGEDLKSRIEETRRRIREELDKPFAAVDEEPFADLMPARAAAPAPSLGEFPPAAPPVAPPVSAPAPITDSAPVAAQAPGQPVALTAAPAQPVTSTPISDFDAMKSRIELTRSRLKAKAFDAMMAGESALLGRDEGDDLINPAKRTVTFDSEIEQTVDNTLIEEDR